MEPQAPKSLVGCSISWVLGFAQDNAIGAKTVKHMTGAKLTNITAWEFLGNVHMITKYLYNMVRKPNKHAASHNNYIKVYLTPMSNRAS